MLRRRYFNTANVLLALSGYSQYAQRQPGQNNLSPVGVALHFKCESVDTQPEKAYFGAIRNSGG